jgi:hypothetical protein
MNQWNNTLLTAIKAILGTISIHLTQFSAHTSMPSNTFIILINSKLLMLDLTT